MAKAFMCDICAKGFPHSPLTYRRRVTIVRSLTAEVTLELCRDCANELVTETGDAMTGLEDWRRPCSLTSRPTPHES
ncbi:MAG TPA: hypothetical protein VM537_17420 [Anaerolineae bacterium]|nr:hypothetical protein [Anaerolineae bacterium]